jgi:hypothetical protein
MQGLKVVLCSATVVIASIIVASPLSAMIMTVDFDNLPGGGTLVRNTILTNQYASLGVTFTAFENGSIVESAVIDRFIFSDYPDRSGNYWGNVRNSVETNRRHDTMRLIFSTPVRNVEWLLNTFGVNLATFEAYDAAGVLLETFTTIGDFTPKGFTATNISRIDGHQSFDGMLWGMDNLTFDTSPPPLPPPSDPAPTSSVPEPGTGLLALLGIAGSRIGAVRRRFRLR